MKVDIIGGTYRNNKVSGVFELVKPWTAGVRGGYITVKATNNPIFITATPRINVDQGNFVLLTDSGDEIESSPVTGQPTQTETEEEAMARIRHTFGMLEKVADAVGKGTIRGLIVSGPPGVGKSCGIEKKLKREGIFGVLRGKPNYEIISGVASALGLYQTLYNNREKGFVTVYDDCDKILHDEECILHLKSALNTGDRRRLSWNTESQVLSRAGIPKAFDFEGSIIFLTNERLEQCRGRVADHLKALISRCHYIDMDVNSVGDKLLRIKQMVGDGMLDKFNFSHNESNMIVDWVCDNHSVMREVSLRTVVKVAELVKAHPDDWEDYATYTILIKEGQVRKSVTA